MSKPHGRKPLTTSQQDLAMRYLPLARSLAKPFKLSWPTHRDDFESAACAALVECAGTFDPARNTKFATFARHRIFGALRDVQRSIVALGWRCDPKHAPLITSLPKQAEGKGRVIGADHDDPVDDLCSSIEEVQRLLKRLPPRHREALTLVYVYGYCRNEAAKAVGCSQSRFSFLHSEAMAILGGS